jgi:hypothetical protein
MTRLKKIYRVVDYSRPNYDVGITFNTLKDVKKHIKKLRTYHGKSETLSIKIQVEFTLQEYKKVGVREDDINRT